MNKDLSFAELLGFLKKNIIVVLITAVVFAVITYVIASSMAETTHSYTFSYEVTVLWNQEEDTLSPSGALTAANFAKAEINTLKEKMKGSKLLNAAIEKAGYKGRLSSGAFASMISFQTEADTNIIKVTVTNPNREGIKNLSNVYSELVPYSVERTYSSLQPLEPVTYAGAYTTPVKTYTMVAFAMGFAAMLVLLYFIEALDTKIKTAAEIEKKYEIANLGSVPNFFMSGGKNYKAYKKGGYGNYEKQ